jgi:basic membrane protein A
LSDPEWGAATAKQALDQGADVIFGAGGSTGNGALQEVAAAAGAGTDLFCIGVDTDQWETLPAAHPCLISSAMKLITPSVVELIGMYGADGTMTSGNYFGGAGLARSMISRIRSRRKSRTSWRDRRRVSKMAA